VAAAASAWALLFWARFNFNIDGAEFTAGMSPAVWLLLFRCTRWCSSGWASMKGSGDSPAWLTCVVSFSVHLSLPPALRSFS
jgi:hypothetical protein